MNKRTIVITITIPDNDLIEHQLYEELKGVIGGQNIKSYRKLPIVEHLKDDPQYKELLKQKLKAGDNLYNYIDKNRK